MANHTVSVKDFDGVILRSEICGSYGKGESKTIMCVTDFVHGTVRFEVHASSKVILDTPTLAEAVELYNKTTK